MTVSQASAVAAPGPGVRGFKAEMDGLLVRMRGLGFSYDEVAAEVWRRYPVRPRHAYRLAWGWTLDQVSARFSQGAAGEGTDPDGRASMTGPHLCEIEKWPDSDRAFKGIVGLKLKALGLDGELVVYSDETAFDTFAEIIATVPGPGNDGGQVCVTDEGGLTWTRDYWAGTAAVVSAPGLCGQVADLASVAGSVVGAVTRAMSLLRPAMEGRAGHG